MTKVRLKQKTMRENMNRVYQERIEKVRKMSQLSEYEKIEIEIGVIKSRIKNVEYDLLTHKENINILGKKECLQIQLLEIEKKFQELENERRYTNMSDVMKVASPVMVQTGHYSGTIVRTETREVMKDAKYKDYYIEIETPQQVQKPMLKVSFPRYVSKNSGLGRFLEKFGVVIIPEQEVDTDIPVGCLVEFDVVNPSNPESGVTYSTIVPDTIKAKGFVRKEVTGVTTTPPVVQ